MTTAQNSSIRQVRCSAHDADAARRGLHRWLSELDPRHYGLPAEAILFVRQARAPLHALAGNRADDPLVEAVRFCARPAIGSFVPAAAAAVWFADEAELLACLARDVVAGVSAQHWWWPIALGAAPDTTEALRRWVANAREVPRALAASPFDWQHRWLQAISATGRARLLEALAAQFPVGEAAKQSVIAHDAAQPAIEMASALAGSSTALCARALHEPPASSLPRDGAGALLSLARALADDPLHALDGRDPAILQSTREVIGRQDNCGDLSTEPRSDAASDLPGSSLNGDASDSLVGIDARHMRLSNTPNITADRLADRDAARANARISIEAVLPSATTAPHDGSGTRRSAPLAEPIRHALHHVADGAAHLSAPPPRQALMPDAARYAMEGRACATVSTQFGGLLFLLNAAISLGLYGDFSQPRHAGLLISPWRFLHHAGRSCFGRRFVADPLATWLLDRFARSKPLEFPSSWSANPQSLQALSADTRPWHALTASNGLMLRHPRGFAVAWMVHDGPDAVLRNGTDMLEALCVDLALTSATRDAIAIHRCPHPLRFPQNILDAQVSLLAARLSLALGLPTRKACALTIQIPGRLQAKSGRVDMHLSLADLPLALRLAGLDRDPGWLPAAGCDIRFHFDA